MAVTQSIFSTVLDYAEKNDASRVLKVNLKIGKITGVVGDCVKFYFEVMSKGTLAEGARLEIEEVVTKARCYSCGQEFEIKDNFDLVCPNCSNFGAEILSGKELFIESIEIERNLVENQNRAD